ncbi:FUSC family protein [Oleiharenicola sp. Vm1]|uniref:FUSC family protein n=1 Tax=Oleiharenicola sp. Vm1 TaxID=3398393 RepID=UPI0039F4DFC3
MQRSGLWSRIDAVLEERRLKPDLARGLRATVGFMLPVLAALWWKLPFDVTFAAITAQNVAMVDVRGSYPLRLGLLLAMTAVFAGSGWLGAFGAPALAPALAVIGGVTLASGAWRHVIPDYGPSIASTSVFLTLLALALPGGETVASQHFLAALAGGLLGVLVQVALWPFRSEHPLRRIVSDSWLALSDLLDALTPDAARAAADRQRAIAEREAQLRLTLDQTRHTLETHGGRPGPLLPRLHALNHAAARLFTRVVALNSALENLRERTDAPLLAASLAPVFSSLVNTTRLVAVTVVSRQPSHLAAVEVRLVRLSHLLQATEDRVAGHEPGDPALHQLANLLHQLGELVPETRAALRATIARAGERAAFSLELLDLHARALRPLAAAINLRWPPEAALVRFTIRLASLQLLGVAVMKHFGFSRGYWLPLTMLVVLQPDYGTTRLRAAQRVLGTIAGGVLASALLWLPLPGWAILAAMALTMAGFAFWLKRNYAVAVFFITLFVVLITEAQERVSVAFTLERLAATLAGGVLALAAAYLFWPVWERGQFPQILARALGANRAYLQAIGAALAEGRRFDDRLIAAKRAAESANGALFSSLQRMSAEPKHQQADVDAAAALANGNQRLTSALTGLAVQLGGAPLSGPALTDFVHLAGEALAELAREDRGPRLAELRAALDRVHFPSRPRATDAAAARTELAAYLQFARCATELDAMLLEAASGPAGAGLGPAASR